MPAPSPTIQVITNPAALAALAPAWNDLAAATGNPQLHHDWIATAAQSFFSADQLRVVVLRDGDTLLAAAPLVQVGSGWSRQLVAVGHYDLYEPTDFLYRTAADLGPLVAAVAGLGLPARLYRVPADGAVARAAWPGGAPWAGPVADRPTSSPYLDIVSDWAAFEAGLKSRTRNDLSRARRRAERRGTLDCVFHLAEPDTVDSLLSRFLDVERRSWKLRNGSAITSERRLHGFFVRFTRRAAASGGLHFAFLDLDGRPVAAQMFQVRHDRLWIYKIAFDMALAEVSPGNLLTHQVVRFAFDAGLRGVEFLGASEPWLDKWTGGVRRQVDLAWYPPTALGLARRLRDRSPAVRRGADALRLAKGLARGLKRRLAGR